MGCGVVLLSLFFIIYRLTFYDLLLLLLNICTDLSLNGKSHWNAVLCDTHTPEKVFIGRVDFPHCLPLLPSLSLHTGRQHSHDCIAEVGGAAVRRWQHINVREPIRSFSSVAFTHQEDTEGQQRGDLVFPAGKEKWVPQKRGFGFLKRLLGCVPFDKRPQVAVEDSWGCEETRLRQRNEHLARLIDYNRDWSENHRTPSLKLFKIIY